jgi:hypothetical protein
VVGAMGNSCAVKVDIFSEENCWRNISYDTGSF